ncbi:MAG: nickel pincer cofactor biosynthesis protein LarC [Candidatus Bathyarchaeia archaeon]
MPKLTFIDCQTAGISGDMLLAALIDAGADIGRIQEILELIPKHYPRCKSLHLVTREVKKHEFRSCSVDFTISEKDEETPAQELIQATDAIADASNLSERAKSFARATIRALTKAESKLHGVQISEAHLHEAGSTDTLADIFGAAAACDSLGVFDGEICSSAVAVGGGPIAFSHGTVASPAPAVLEIATRSGIPIIGGPEAGELATPTGVSMLAALTTKFLESYPPMVPENVGYGAGKNELAKTPNLLRVVIGRAVSGGFESETVQVLETNLDDVPGETLGYALQRILESGAMDAWITPALFKKTRPGQVLHAICEPRDAQKIAEIMIQETGTLGVRFQLWNRITLQREIEKIKLHVSGKIFDVRMKVARDGFGKIVRVKPEFEDIRAIAEVLSIPAREVSDMVMREAMQSEARRKSGV